MKKLLVLALTIVLAFSFVACGEEPANNGGVGGAKNDPTPLDITKKEAYVGSWSKENTTDSPFSMNITLNADGTGKMGKNTDVAWTFVETTKPKHITIVLKYSDGTESEESTAVIEQDGKLYWNYDFNVKTSTGEMIEVEQVVFERK